MGAAGRALKQVLETYDISQNRLAVTMGVGRSNIHRWVHELQDPSAETVLAIVRGLQKIDPKASDGFLALYLGEVRPNKPTQA